MDSTADKQLSQVLAELKDSADGLTADLTELQHAVTEMEESTRRLSENQDRASQSLSNAAESLSEQATHSDISEEPVQTQVYSAYRSQAASADD